MTINATLINLYNVCPRECWLHANGVRMEHTSETVADGKLLHETSYADRNAKHSELSIEAVYNTINLYGKIDFFDTKNKVVHEIKRSNKVEQAHIWQVKFYLWLLELNGIETEKGIIEYSKLREREEVYLDEEDKDYLKKTIKNIKTLVKQTNCPPVINARICKSCSYYDFCYAGE